MCPLAMVTIFEFAFNVVYFLLQALGQGARLFLVELIQYVILIVAVILLAGPFGLMGVGAARIITGIAVAIAAAVAAPEMYRATLLRVLRPAVILVVWAALAGITARLCAALVPGAAGIVVGVAAGGAMFLCLAWMTDERLRTGVRECLALFFPILGSHRSGYGLEPP